MGAAVRSRSSASIARRSRTRDGAGTSLRAGMRGELAQIQRARILAAAIEVVAEHGPADVNVGHVIQRSGVSRRTFYESFVDRDDCLLTAFEQAVTYAAERVLPAFMSGESWRERIRSGLVALLQFLDEQPAVGRMLVLGPVVGSPAATERRSELTAQLTAAVADGERESNAISPMPMSAEGVVGGALSIIHARLLEAEHEPLVDLANPLMSMMVLPYLGAAAARRELGRAVPHGAPAREQSKPIQADPFKAAGMRLTYRTMRVLAAIGEHPSSSNRTIGAAAGIVDQGQTSKLLARLERLGLIATGQAAKGGPNAWSLTDAGRRVEQSIGAYTTASPSQVN